MADLTGFCQMPNHAPPCTPTASLIVPSLLPQLALNGKESLAPEPATVVPTDHDIISRDHTEEVNGDEGERR